MSIIYNHKTNLLKDHRDLLRETLSRINGHVGDAYPIPAPKFFKHATVEFFIQDGKERPTGKVMPVYTVCLFENKGKRSVGVAKLGNSPRSEHYEEFIATVGQNIAFVRAVRQYLLETPYPINHKNGVHTARLATLSLGNVTRSDTNTSIVELNLSAE